MVTPNKSAEPAANSDVGAAPSKGLHIGLWVGQSLLAAIFLMAGGMKLVAPVEELAKNMPWVHGAMGGLVRVIGLVEVLGALGLILPAATRIKPILTPLAAGGLLLVMLLAAATHISRGEFPSVGPPIVLGALAAFVAWGRYQAAPIAARNAGP